MAIIVRLLLNHVNTAKAATCFLYNSLLIRKLRKEVSRCNSKETGKIKVDLVLKVYSYEMCCNFPLELKNNISFTLGVCCFSFSSPGETEFKRPAADISHEGEKGRAALTPSVSVADLLLSHSFRVSRCFLFAGDFLSPKTLKNNTNLFLTSFDDGLFVIYHHLLKLMF